MSDAAAFRDTPWAFPWERRQHARVPVDLRVRLHGPRGELPAHAVNVSLGGAMLRLREHDLCAVPPLSDRSVLHAVARSTFGAHLEASFLERGVTVGARLARMVLPPDEPDRLFLGLRFLEELTPLQLKRLGVPAYLLASADGGAPGPAAAAADARTSLWVTVAPAADEGAGALCSGPLLGVADRAVAFRDREGDAGEAVARLAGKPLVVRLRDGQEPVWSAAAHLITVRVLSSLGGAVEATLLTDQDPRPALAPRLAAASPAPQPAGA